MSRERPRRFASREDEIVAYLILCGLLAGFGFLVFRVIFH